MLIERIRTFYSSGVRNTVHQNVNPETSGIGKRHRQQIFSPIGP